MPHWHMDLLTFQHCNVYLTAMRHSNADLTTIRNCNADRTRTFAALKLVPADVDPPHVAVYGCLQRSAPQSHATRRQSTASFVLAGIRVKALFKGPFNNRNQLQKGPLNKCRPDARHPKRHASGKARCTGLNCRNTACTHSHARKRVHGRCLYVGCMKRSISTCVDVCVDTQMGSCATTYGSAPHSATPWLQQK